MDAVLAIANVIVELADLEEKTRKKQKSQWVRKWILRRQKLGASATLLKELALEDIPSFCNFFRIDEDMFTELLNKVSESVYLNTSQSRKIFKSFYYLTK